MHMWLTEWCKHQWSPVEYICVMQWLDADVEVVTFGSPAVGNQQFADVRIP